MAGVHYLSSLYEMLDKWVEEAPPANQAAMSLWHDSRAEQLKQLKTAIIADIDEKIDREEAGSKNWEGMMSGGGGGRKRHMRRYRKVTHRHRR